MFGPLQNGIEGCRRVHMDIVPAELLGIVSDRIMAEYSFPIALYVGN